MSLSKVGNKNEVGGVGQEVPIQKQPSLWQRIRETIRDILTGPFFEKSVDEGSFIEFKPGLGGRIYDLLFCTPEEKVEKVESYSPDQRPNSRKLKTFDGSWSYTHGQWKSNDKKPYDLTDLNLEPNGKIHHRFSTKKNSFVLNDKEKAMFTAEERAKRAANYRKEHTLPSESHRFSKNPEQVEPKNEKRSFDAKEAREHSEQLEKVVSEAKKKMEVRSKPIGEQPSVVKGPPVQTSQKLKTFHGSYTFSNGQFKPNDG